MKRPTTIQQQESFTVAGSTWPIRRNQELQSVRQPGSRPVFETPQPRKHSGLADAGL